jgi:hypothetical protein
VRAYAIDRAGNQSAGTSKTVETDTTPPGAVWGLTGFYDREAQQIAVTWADPVDADLKEIRLAWQAGPGALTTITVEPGIGAYTIDTVKYNSGEYSITVTAADQAGNAGRSETVNIRTDSRPATPGSLTVVATANSGELKVSWNEVNGATSYDLRYGTVSTGAGATELGVDGGTTLTKTLGGLTNGTVYYVWVRTKNGTVPGEWSNSVTGIPKDNKGPAGVIITGPGEVITISASGSTIISYAASGQLTFTVSGKYDAGTLEWRVNNEKRIGTGNQLTIKARDYGIRTYNVTVLVKKDGQLFSQELSFRVIS